jgi:hypothetical protein
VVPFVGGVGDSNKESEDRRCVENGSETGPTGILRTLPASDVDS